MRRDRWVVFAVGVLTLTLGSPVWADDPSKGSKGIEDPARVGRPGERTERTRDVRGTTAASGRELSGKVVKADSRTLYLEHMGAIVPLKLDDKTEFAGEGLKSSRDLAAGQEVRASFTVEKETTNVATRISLARASERGTASGSSPRVPDDTGRTPRGDRPVPHERTPGMPPGEAPIPRDPGERVPPDPVPPVPKY